MYRLMILIILTDVLFCERSQSLGSCGQDLPTFDQPKPVPETFQNKVVEVFRRCGSREIPAKNFRRSGAGKQHGNNMETTL